MMLYSNLIITLVCLGMINPALTAVHPKRRALSTSRVIPSDHVSEDRYTRIRRQGSGRQYQSLSIRQLLPVLSAMGQSIRSIDGKLNRHESREAQAADFAKRTLNSLTGDHSKTTNSLITMGQQLAAVEERVIAIMTLVQTSDERQRVMLAKLSDGLDRLLLASQPTLGNAPGVPEMALLPPSVLNMDRTVQNMGRQLSELDDKQENRIRGVASQVQQLSDSMNQHVARVINKQDDIMSGVEACTSDSNNIEETSSCEKMESSMKERLDMIAHMTQNQERMLIELGQGTESKFEQTHSDLQAIVNEIQEDEDMFNHTLSIVIDSLQGFQLLTTTDLSNLQDNLNSILNENDALITEKVEALENRLKEGQSMILGSLDEATSMTDNLQSTVSDNYELLSKEISGLNKVEQVMINTADAVLDTKRSIEFGIQQVIMELSEIVSQSGKAMNSTLSDQISAISFNILKNQTSALTNMTQKMEGEIAQVWRQIGIMYQQVERSVVMLDTLQDTTDQHMNVSLSKVGNMDESVGEINGKVSEVEDNLNYLLGRLTLVLSEFSQMKAGVGDELDRLREMAAEFNVPNGNPDNLKYNINRKRHIIEPYNDNYYN